MCTVQVLIQYHCLLVNVHCAGTVMRLCCRPLSEGKQLKMKFDDIFASTRYVKALDAIKKQHVELKNQHVLYKSEHKHLKRNMEQAAEVRASADACSNDILMAQ